jgi:FSR family fosmidomycin resistance protein-like MFS transporter
MSLKSFKTWARFFPVAILALYGVELLDEFVYGLQGAVIPKIRDDLALTYTQIGLLTTIPGLIGLVADPLIGLLADTRYRRVIALGGISATALGLLLTGISSTFAILLIAFSILFIASTAYVNLAEATLVDRDPNRAEQTMARWTVLGYIGVTLAPLIVTALFAFDQDWRGVYIAAGFVAMLYALLLARQKFDLHAGAEHAIAPRKILRDIVAAIRTPELVRWIVLTECADLLLDKLLEVTALYFHDVAGVELAVASGAVAVFTIAGLIGNLALVPALEKISGTRVLRVTAFIALIVYVAFLIVPNVWIKFALIAILSFCTASWFPITRGKTFAVLPGQSGLVIAITSLGNLSSIFVPFILGNIADAVGLQSAMWILALGPIALLIGLPRHSVNGKW